MLLALNSKRCFDLEEPIFACNSGMLSFRPVL